VRRLPQRTGPAPAPPLPRSWGRGRRPLRGTSKRPGGGEGPRGNEPAPPCALSALLFVATHDRNVPVLVVSGMTTLHQADSGWGEWAYATQHRLGPERFRNVACLIYGSDPEGFEGLHTAGLVPPTRGSGAAPPPCAAWTCGAAAWGYFN
jgi:hypothetical protein